MPETKLEGLEEYLQSHSNSFWEHLLGKHIKCVEEYYASHTSLFINNNVRTSKIFRNVKIRAHRTFGRFSFVALTPYPIMVKIYEHDAHPRYYQEMAFSGCRFIAQEYKTPVAAILISYIRQTNGLKVRQNQWSVTKDRERLISAGPTIYLYY